MNDPEVSGPVSWYEMDVRLRFPADQAPEIVVGVIERLGYSVLSVAVSTSEQSVDPSQGALLSNSDFCAESAQFLSRTEQPVAVHAISMAQKTAVRLCAREAYELNDRKLSVSKQQEQPVGINLSHLLAAVRRMETTGIRRERTGKTTWNIFAGVINTRMGSGGLPIVLPWNPDIHHYFSKSYPEKTRRRAIKHLAAMYQDIREGKQEG